MRIYLKEIRENYPDLEILNYNPEIFFENINHDSRVKVPNSLFVPIIGEKFDGHDFVKDAFTSGSVVSIFQKNKNIHNSIKDEPLILVDDIYIGLKDIAKLIRRKVNVPLISITGSTGKTTTREMISQILSSKGKVLKSNSNINTLWGNAEILMKYDSHKYIIMEFGMDRKGEIKTQCEAFDPDIGGVLNVGHVHSMQLGGIENVFLEKRALTDYLLSHNRKVVINIDDERLARISSEGNNIIWFGNQKKAMFEIKDTMLSKSGTSFKIKNRDKEYTVNLNLFGKGYAYNATCALAICNQLDFSIEDSVSSLKQYQGFKGRFDIKEIKGGTILINDAYNANPISMKMSLDTFEEIWGITEIYKILVLGDMKELGKVSSDEHKKAGEKVKKMKVDKVYYLGEYFKDFNIGEQKESLESVYSELKEDIERKPKSVILFKASNSIELSKLFEMF